MVNLFEFFDLTHLLNDAMNIILFGDMDPDNKWLVYDKIHEADQMLWDLMDKANKNLRQTIDEINEMDKAKKNLRQAIDEINEMIGEEKNDD